MNNLKHNTLRHKTAKFEFDIDSLIVILPVNTIESDYNKFSAICQAGCRNYNAKYSCPPYSKEYTAISKDYKYIVVNILKVDTLPYKKIYNTIRVIHNVVKSIQKKIFLSLLSDNDIQDHISILSNGSCRLCKICNLKTGKTCKHPNKMWYSLEATGVNVNELVLRITGKELQWYSQDNYPEYNCVTGGVLTNNPELISLKLDLLTKNYNE